MTVSQVIDQVLSYTDNIPPTDADYANRRARLLNYLREVQASIWYAKEWQFARRQTVLTVLAGDAFVNVPADFLGLGEYGTVLLADQSDGSPLDNVPEYRIIESRNTGSTTDSPGIFSIFGQDPSTLEKRFQFPLNSGAYDIIVSYLKDVAALSDGGGDNTGLDEIPVQYHQTCVIPGLQARTLQSKGDASWNTYQGIHLTTLNDMKAKERGRQGTIWQLPSFFGSRYA